MGSDAIDEWCWSETLCDRTGLMMTLRVGVCHRIKKNVHKGQCHITLNKHQSLSPPPNSSWLTHPYSSRPRDTNNIGHLFHAYSQIYIIYWNVWQNKTTWVMDSAALQQCRVWFYLCNCLPLWKWLRSIPLQDMVNPRHPSPSTELRFWLEALWHIWWSLMYIAWFLEFLWVVSTWMITLIASNIG